MIKNKLSQAAIDRFKKAVNAQNLLVLGHANALDMYQHAVKGVDIITRGMWNWGKERVARDISICRIRLN